MPDEKKRKLYTQELSIKYIEKTFCAAIPIFIFLFCFKSCAIFTRREKKIRTFLMSSRGKCNMKNIFHYIRAPCSRRLSLFINEVIMDSACAARRHRSMRTECMFRIFLHTHRHIFMWLFRMLLYPSLNAVMRTRRLCGHALTQNTHTHIHIVNTLKFSGAHGIEWMRSLAQR